MDSATDVKSIVGVLELEQKAREWYEEACNAMGLEQECWEEMESCLRIADMRADEAAAIRNDGERGFDNLGAGGFNLTEDFAEAVQKDRQLRSIAQRLDQMSKDKRDDAKLCSSIAVFAEDLQQGRIWVACAFRVVAAIQKRRSEGTSRPTDLEEKKRFVERINTQTMVLKDTALLVESIQNYLDKEWERKSAEVEELVAAEGVAKEVM